MGTALDLCAPFKDIFTKQMTALEKRTHTNSYRSFPLTFWLYFSNFTMSSPQNGTITETASQQLLKNKTAVGVSLSSLHHIPGGMKRTFSNWYLCECVSAYIFHLLLALCLGPTRGRRIIKICHWFQTFHFIIT